MFTFLLPPPNPRAIGIIDFNGKCQKNIGAQSHRGKILSRKGFSSDSFLSKIEMQVLRFQSEEIRVNGKERRTGRHSHFGKLKGWKWELVSLSDRS
jgi:hypothetical protein